MMTFRLNSAPVIDQGLQLTFQQLAHNTLATTKSWDKHIDLVELPNQHSHMPTYFFTTRSPLNLSKFPNSSEVPVDLSLSTSRNQANKSCPQKSPTIESQQICASAPNKLQIPNGEFSKTDTFIKGPGVSTFLCAHCPFRAYTTDQIESHIKREHRPVSAGTECTRKFTCNHCPYQTSSEQCMVRHLLASHKSVLLPPKSEIPGASKQLSCYYCCFSSDETTMIMHIPKHFFDRPPCNACSSCVRWKDTTLSPVLQKILTSSMKTYSGRRNRQHKGTRFSFPVVNQKSSYQKCESCNQCFQTNAQLQAHFSTRGHTQKLSVSLPLNGTLVQNPPAVISTNLTKLLSVSAPVFTEKAIFSTGGTALDLSDSVVLPELLTPPLSDSDSLLSVDTVPTVRDVAPSMTHGVTAQEDCESSEALESVVTHIAEQDIQSSPEIISKSKKISSHYSLSMHDGENNLKCILGDSREEVIATKKRKLAVKIYKNKCGEYESQRDDSLKSPIGNSLTDSELRELPKRTHSLQLNVAIPLDLLPEKRRLLDSKRICKANLDQDICNNAIPKQVVNFNQMSIEINHALRGNHQSTSDENIPGHSTDHAGIKNGDRSETTETEGKWLLACTFITDY